jgi:hypothetical protein
MPARQVSDANAGTVGASSKLIPDDPGLRDRVDDAVEQTPTKAVQDAVGKSM